MIGPRQRLDRSAAAIGALTVVAANLQYLIGLPLVLDPVLAMDPLYIEMAQHPVSSILSQDPAWGPFYALWFKPFVAVLGDPIAVYTANIYALSVGVSVLIYLYVLVLTRRAALGVGAACFFLTTDLNVPLAGKVNDFALLVVLAGLWISELVPAGCRRLTVVAAGALLASYARPELYPAALCLWVAAAWRTRLEVPASGRTVLLWPAALLVSMLLCGAWIGVPVLGAAPNGGRLLAAFQEHFAWNWSLWHDRPGYFLAIWEEEFGTAQSVLQACWNNPGAVAHHVAQNLLGTLRFMATSAFDHFPLLAPVTSALAVKAESLLVSAAVFTTLIVTAVRRVLRRQLFDRYRHLLFPYAVLAIVPLGSAVAIFPLARYLVIPAVLLLLTGTLAASVFIPETSVISARGRILAALVCLAAIPRPFVLPSAYVVADAPFKARMTIARPIMETLALIRSLGLPPPVQVLTFTDGLGELLGPDFHEVKAWQKGERPLDEYIRDNHIDLIVTMEHGTESFLVKDPYWTLIQKNPEAAGFIRVSVPDQDAARVYVRSTLLPQRE